MQEKVEYILTIKDLLTGALNKAEKQADTFEKKLGNLGKTAIAAFGAYEAYNFIKESVAAYDEAAQASAQLDATLKSTGNAANLSRKALDEQAQSLMTMTRFDDDAITASQALLGTFTEIKDKVFMDAIPAITDLATKMGGDMKGATIQVGKALNDPIKGITALSRVGVSFSEDQKKVIKSLVETGDKAGAQRMILAELNKEFGGSAKAAAEAGTGSLVILANQLGNVKETIGELVVDMITAFKPAIISIGDALAGFADFLKDHKKELKAVVVGVGIAATAFGIWRVYTLGAALATRVMSLNMASLNAVLLANPIGIVVGALAALGAALYYAWNNFEGFRKFVYGVFEVIKNSGDIITTFLSAVKDKIIGTLTMDDEQVARGEAKMKEAGKLMREAWNKGQKEGSKKFKEDQEKPAAALLTDNKNLLTETTATDTAKGAGKAASAEPKGSPTAKATTITISIEKLVENLSINTTNVSESASKIREMVATALTDALNDSQIIAGG